MAKMEKREGKKAPLHCLILPYPITGHINPMLQFAKRLLHKNITITLIITKHLAKTTQFSSHTNISLETISDGFDDGHSPNMDPDLYLTRFKESGSSTLREALHRLAGSGRPVDCVVYDPFLPWGLDVSKSLGLAAAAFFTQSCAVDQIYHSLHKGDLKLPLPDKEPVSIPGLPPLEPRDMPSFISSHGSYPRVLEMVVGQFEGLEKADWLFFNTFHELEEEVIGHMAKLHSAPVKAIGPSVPSVYLDKRLPDDGAYGLSVYKPATGACMDWLDERGPGTVVYASFGSLAQVGERQMEELAWGLKSSGKHFLWVVRSTEHSKLPKGFDEGSERLVGLIVPWCPQLDVLAHEAVCCFVTHCGWNSTLEALSLGVPMVGVPQWTDQATNSKFVTDVWGVGVRAPADGDGLVRREAIAGCIREVVEEGDRREEIRRNAVKWKGLAREAMDEGGSSDKNIQEFVSSLC